MEHGSGGRRFTRDVGKMLAREASAYLRVGLLAPGGIRHIRENAPSAGGELGVVFVPGVGANSSQFTALKGALDGVADWFDAFEYWTYRSTREIAAALSDHLVRRGRSAERILLVGHSLGGLLGRIVMQSEAPPPAVAGFVTICSPLHGTWRAKLAPSPTLRSLAPDSDLMRGLFATADRLGALNGAVLNIGVRYDSFVSPWDSAFLEGTERLVLEDSGHVAALFDERTHRAVIRMAKRIRGEE